MTLLDYARAVATANGQLAHGDLGWDGHYAEMGRLWKQFGAEHNPAEHNPDQWGAVVQAAAHLPAAAPEPMGDRSCTP